MFLRCHKNLLCKIEFNNSEDCLYLRKGFLVCSIKDRYREKVTKTENNDEALKRYFTNVEKENLISRKKVVVDHFNYFLHIRTACLSLDQTVSYYFPGIKVNWVLQRNLDDRYLSYK